MIYSGPLSIQQNDSLVTGLHHAWVFGRNGAIAPDVVNGNHVVLSRGTSTAQYVAASNRYGPGWLLNNVIAGRPQNTVPILTTSSGGAMFAFGTMVGDPPFASWGTVMDMNYSGTEASLVQYGTGMGTLWGSIFNSDSLGVENGRPFALCMSWTKADYVMMMAPLTGYYEPYSASVSISSPPTIAFGQRVADPTNTSYMSNVILNCAYMWSRAISPEECARLAYDPYAVFRKNNSVGYGRSYSTPAGGAVAGQGLRTALKLGV